MQEAESLLTMVDAKALAAVHGKETTPSPREVIKTPRYILFILFQRSSTKCCAENSLRNNSVLSLGDLAFPHTSLYKGSSPSQPDTFCTGQTARPGFAQLASQERGSLRLRESINIFLLKHSRLTKKPTQQLRGDTSHHTSFT